MVDVVLSWVEEGQVRTETVVLPARQPLEDPRTLTVVRGTVGGDLDLETIELDDGQDAQEQAARLRSQEGVLAVQVDLVMESSRRPSPPALVLAAAVPDGVVQDGRNVVQPGTGHDVPAFHGTAMALLVHAMAPTAPIVRVRGRLRRRLRQRHGA